MSLTAGTRLGPYEIVAPLGAGGMGEVYKAKDTRLDRTVAIKIVPSSDPDRRERFAREAKAIAGLSHPHICVLYDVGEQPSPTGTGPPIDFIVIEYLEGESLGDRLKAATPSPTIRETLRGSVARSKRCFLGESRQPMPSECRIRMLVGPRAPFGRQYGLSSVNRPMEISRLTMGVAACAAAVLISVTPFVLPARASASGAEAGGADRQVPQLPPETTAPPPDSYEEIREGLIRLPLAAVLGTILALRPRHKGQTRRNALVVQTQIMLAVVGAVIMLVVGQSLARAFGIVGAANLIRYRSTIDDPKEAVVMLCALAAGLAAGVGLYRLAPFATVFMAAVLWVVEYFEPAARKNFELRVATKDAASLRPKLEGVLTGFQLEFELLSESEGELGYSISVPITVRTRDVSDTIRLISDAIDASIEWDEKKKK